MRRMACKLRREHANDVTDCLCARRHHRGRSTSEVNAGLSIGRGPLTDTRTRTASMFLPIHVARQHVSKARATCRPTEPEG